MDLLWIAGGAVVVGILGFLLINRMGRKDIKREIKVILFEQVGNDKAYCGEFSAFEMDDKTLGIYVLIGKLKKPVCNVSPGDFFHTKTAGFFGFGSVLTKALLICKYSDDDYRVMARLRDGEWFKRVPQYDAKGGPLIGKDGEPVYDVEVYEEPIGVVQTAREAIRFNRSFQKKMEERMQAPGKFWDQWGNAITIGFVSIILMVTFIAMTNSHTKLVETVTDAFGEGAADYVKKVEEPGFAQRMLTKWETKDKEENAPPS